MIWIHLRREAMELEEAERRGVALLGIRGKPVFLRTKVSTQGACNALRRRRPPQEDYQRLRHLLKGWPADRSSRQQARCERRAGQRPALS